MESDPAALLPMLATAEGRKELQVSSLANTVSNIFSQLQKNGMAFLDAVEVTAPLFAQITQQETASMPLRTQPELLWAHWLAKNNAVSSAKLNWVDTNAERLMILGFDWAWTYALASAHLKPEQTLLQEHVNIFIEQLPKNIQRSVWELSYIERIDNTKPKYKTTQKAWQTLFKEIDIHLHDIAIRPGKLPVGAAVAFIELAQHTSYDELLNFTQSSCLEIVLPLSDFKKHNSVLTGDWSSPVGGLFFLAGTPFLGSTSLPANSEVASLLGLADAVGLNINDADTVRQLILSMKTPKTETPSELEALQNVLENTFS